MSLLEIENVVKEYKAGVRANDSISLSVEAGEMYGLFGPNGAGKTTLVNQIIGLLSPTSGRIALAGVDTVDNPVYARKACSTVRMSSTDLLSTCQCRIALLLDDENRNGWST